MICSEVSMFNGPPSWASIRVFSQQREGTSWRRMLTGASNGVRDIGVYSTEEAFITTTSGGVLQRLSSP
jgi:hypothetical protein